MKMNILGISALYHDSAAALCHDGKIISAVQEERFTRLKNDSSFPSNAIKHCLTNLKGELDCVVYYDNPLLTLDRWLCNLAIISPDNKKMIDKTFDKIFAQKLWIHDLVKTFLKQQNINTEKLKIYVCKHHISHAASAFYPSPFESAAILTIDGVGEWTTTSLGVGQENNIKLIKELRYPDSLGLLYSAFTHFCGFKVNSGEYKLMGLAPYGKPLWKDKILAEMIDLKEDGSFKINQKYFSYMYGERMWNDAFESFFGVKSRLPDTHITQAIIDIAASIQAVLEVIIVKLAVHLKKITNEQNLVLAGGCALNCVANGLLLKEKIFENIWIQPAAGDAGGAIGAALYAHYALGNRRRKIDSNDSQQGSFLGPAYTRDEISDFLNKKKVTFLEYQKNEDLYYSIATHLSRNKVIGLFNGRMEFGPRALGHRSIIASSQDKEMQAKVNLKIKYRESFRPFAPAVRKENISQYFDIKAESPYMLLVAHVAHEIRHDVPKIEYSHSPNLLDIINQKRSTIPAVTHVDYSARIQTVDKERNPYLYNIIKAFEEQTGCGVVLNTSFNVRGEPIVCSLEDAYNCFMATEMDVLVLENFILLKENIGDNEYQ